MAFIDKFDTPVNALAALKKYSIQGASAATDYDFTISNSARVDVGGRHWTHTVVDRQKIGHATFTKSEPIESINATRSNFTPRGASTILIEVHINTRPANSLPVYFLPWNGGGGAMETTIPPNPVGAFDNVAHPEYFFTAALSGCSIFFKGTPQNPTIFHCGYDGDTPGATAQAHWTDVMNELSQTGRSPGAYGAEQVHNVDYADVKRGAQGAGKRDAEVVSKSLMDLLEGSYTIEHVRPWGAVFGIRTGANWQFYLQQNVTVDYYKLTARQTQKKKMLGLSKKTITEIVQDGPSRSVSRPVVTREIFPAGGGATAKLMESWRSIRV